MPSSDARVQALIIDHSALLPRPISPSVATELRETMEWLRQRGLKIVVFSTHGQDIGSLLESRSLPPIDLYLTRDDVGENKGSPRWVEEVLARLELQRGQLAYVGDDVRDWRTALNSGTFYLHAGWSAPLGSGMTAVLLDRPRDLSFYLSELLLIPPRWEYTLDDPSSGLIVRCLLGSSAELARSKLTTFTLQNVFTHKRHINVGQYNARDLLVFHAVSSLYLEGLIAPNARWLIYPSSKVGAPSGPLAEFLPAMSRIFRGYSYGDVLVRARDTIDTSLERFHARQEGRPANIRYTTQTNSVHINRSRRTTVRDREIIVFDDFTTTGMSLEWARNLLGEAGASRVILLTIGKYGNRYTKYAPVRDDTIAPCEDKRYAEVDFASTEFQMAWHPNGRRLVVKSFSHLVAGRR